MLHPGFHLVDDGPHHSRGYNLLTLEIGDYTLAWRRFGECDACLSR